MGVYLNPGNGKFFEAIRSQIYVDKTELIHDTNSVIQTTDKYICVSRPRRFGKSMAANMLTAYYSKGCHSKNLFQPFKITKNEPDFEKYLNKYNVIFLNMQEFLSKAKNITQMISTIKKYVIREIKKEYPKIDYLDDKELAYCMRDTYMDNQCPYIVIIDEWDCIFRQYKKEQHAQEKYLDFLRDLLKDKEYIFLTYMTGILPIKKYGTHSALNMFSEYSMINPRQLAEFVGFTEVEVENLCKAYHRELSEIKEWYNGYYFKTIGAIYSPRSVVEAVSSGICDTYWNQTETFEALKMYIDLNFEGLKDDVVSMIAGETIHVNTRSFINDMSTFSCKDDVLTLLIHLGYLGYDFVNKTVFIPNNEVREEYINAVSISSWGPVSNALKNSAQMLHAIWNKQADKVSKGMEQAHFETSHLQYNDENALSYTISLALYAARNYYTVFRELPSGKGFADMVYLPRKQFPDKPAIVVELKWDKNARSAITQIKEKQYCKCLEHFIGTILLVGINYDKKTKVHECMIETETLA